MFSSYNQFQDISSHGWNSGRTIHWTTGVFPDDIIEILTTEDDSETVAIEEPDNIDEEDNN